MKRRSFFAWLTGFVGAMFTGSSSQSAPAKLDGYILPEPEYWNPPDHPIKTEFFQWLDDNRCKVFHERANKEIRIYLIKKETIHVSCGLGAKFDGDIDLNDAYAQFCKMLDGHRFEYYDKIGELHQLAPRVYFDIMKFLDRFPTEAGRQSQLKYFGGNS